MNQALTGLLLIALAAPAAAGRPAAGDVELRLAGYQQCVMQAAVRASYGATPNDRIYDVARASCATARTVAAVDRAQRPAYLAAVDAADTRNAAALPTLIEALRERHRGMDALYGAAR